MLIGLHVFTPACVSTLTKDIKSAMAFAKSIKRKCTFPWENILLTLLPKQTRGTVSVAALRNEPPETAFWVNLFCTALAACGLSPLFNLGQSRFVYETSFGSSGWRLPVDSGRPWDSTFICLFVPWVFGRPFRAQFGPAPCWASISEAQVALNEAGSVGMGPQQTQAWSDPFFCLGNHTPFAPSGFLI